MIEYHLNSFNLIYIDTRLVKTWSTNKFVTHPPQLHVLEIQTFYQFDITIEKEGLNQSKIKLFTNYYYSRKKNKRIFYFEKK